MINTIDMKIMRYINLFRKISGISTRNCFIYNNVIIFAVPKNAVSRAVGKNGANMRKIGEILRKKIKVIEMAEKKDELERFVLDIVSPVGFNKLELKNDCVMISAGRQSKASLIGRGRQREVELKNILSKCFGIKKVRII
jgi:NusA-like KH domain protein